MHGAIEHSCLGCLQALLEGISELTACKGVLERHLAVADASLAELALSIPFMQVTPNPIQAHLTQPTSDGHTGAGMT